MKKNRLIVLFFCWMNVNLMASSHLTAEQGSVFRQWFTVIVEDQMTQGLNPRWQQKDCAGLVRFAVNEAFKRHDKNWRQANGMKGRYLPPELDVSDKQRHDFRQWTNSDGGQSQFARALPLIQQNTTFLGKSTQQLLPGDMMFYDQDDSQHIMIWFPNKIIYHTGDSKPKNPKDNGLRQVSHDELMRWPDSRWQPRLENPNFIGYFRFKFLTGV